jgi:hypothetical protein
MSWLGISTSCEIGQEEKHVFGIFWSWCGLEIYTVDEREVFRKRCFSFRGIRKFVIGEREKHEVEVRADFRPVRWNDWTAQLLVDGRIAVDDLTPALRANCTDTLQRFAPLLVIILGSVTLGCLVALAMEAMH